MNDRYKSVADKFKEISALAQVSGLVHWDLETMMPERGVAARAEQAAALSAVIHAKLIAPELGLALRQLAAEPAGRGEDERTCVREWLRDYEKATKLPEDLVRELSSTASLAHDAWVKARSRSDFPSFAPWIEKTIELKRRQADCLGFPHVRYDALLDDYEPHMTVAELDPVLDDLRRGLMPIVAAIRDSGVAIDGRFLTRRFPEAGQEELCREMMAVVGIDTKASRLDRSAHPFCSSIAPVDVRITTRYDERWMTGSLFGVIHESGHALYEQGFEERHFHTPLAESASMGLHESQSRLWENVIGRSRPFVRFLLPRLKKKFPRPLAGVGPEAFYRAINRVEPSPIRVEADEVTYNLHVVLRYEIEKALIAGEIAVKDLPGIWNEKMEAYLGIRPANDAEGVLQDVHWSGGMFGYFPTYALGNLYAAQWWHAIRKACRGIEAQIARGELGPVRQWLREKVHRHGRRFTPAELARQATGGPLDSRYFISYLKEKFGEIYRIRWP